MTDTLKPAHIGLYRDLLVRVARNQISTDLEDEVAILNLDSGLYYGLNEVGSYIWRLIDEPRTVAAIQESILACYEVSPDRCHEDLVRLLGQLSESGLIELSRENSL